MKTLILVCTALVFGLSAGNGVAAGFDMEFCKANTAKLYPGVDPVAGCSCLAGESEMNPAVGEELAPSSDAGVAASGGTKEKVNNTLSDTALAAMAACGYEA